MCVRVCSQVQKTVDQRAKDVAKWETKMEADDDDSLDTIPKPRKA